MTFRELFEIMSTWNAEQLDLDLTVYDQENEEVYKAEGIGYSDEMDLDAILDGKHPVIVFPTSGK